MLRGCRGSVDVCVFTITDDRISGEIIAAHRRGVRVRVISDDRKSTDRGSDVERIDAAGIPVAVDNSRAHMHHKFAIFDGDALLTGSYNWTRSAAAENTENVLLVEDSGIVSRFQEEFARLWSRFRGAAP